MIDLYYDKNKRATVDPGRRQQTVEYNRVLAGAQQQHRQQQQQYSCSTRPNAGKETNKNQVMK
jgi:hypothetical protein